MKCDPAYTIADSNVHPDSPTLKPQFLESLEKSEELSHYLSKGTLFSKEEKVFTISIDNDKKPFPTMDDDKKPAAVARSGVKPPPFRSPMSKLGTAFSSLTGKLAGAQDPQDGTFLETKQAQQAGSNNPAGNQGGLVANTNFGGAAFHVPPDVHGPKVRNFQLGSFSNAVTPEYREQLAGDSLFKFHREATTALKTSFTLKWATMNPETELDFFENNNALMKIIWCDPNSNPFVWIRSFRYLIFTVAPDFRILLFHPFHFWKTITWCRNPKFV